MFIDKTLKQFGPLVFNHESGEVTLLAGSYKLGNDITFKMSETTTFEGIEYDGSKQ